jgi:hypothetical protein
MAPKKPPVPAENRSPKGTGSGSDAKRDDPVGETRETDPRRGDFENVRRNTTNQTHQRDR